jgi:hypothetical protein
LPNKPDDIKCAHDSLIFKKGNGNRCYNRKMIERRIENQSIPIKTIHISPHAKENNILIAPVTHVPKSPTRYIRTSVHPQETSIPHWTTSTQPIARVSSPASVLNSISNTRRPEFIELGGSREKRDSLHKESEQARKMDGST